MARHDQLSVQHDRLNLVGLLAYRKLRFAAAETVLTALIRMLRLADLEAASDRIVLAVPSL